MGIETALMVGGLGLSAAGSFSQAAGQKREGETAARIGEFNAQLSEQNAEIARKQALMEEIAIRRGAETFKGTQRVKSAKSGVVVGTGSSLELLADTAKKAELQAMTARAAGELEATGHEAEAISRRYSGQSAQVAGRSRAGSTLLSGAGRLFSSGYSAFA